MIPVDSIEQYSSEKILSFEDSVRKIRELKSTGKIVGLCNGGFDLTHPGHVKHFESAKKLCEVLFVSITSDKFVNRRKGSGRPVYSDKLRSYMVAAIEFVDFVVVADFQRGVEAIELLKPSYYIKGPDFVHKTTPGITAEREAINEEGGEMKYTTEPPMSTTKIIDYVKNEVNSHELLIVVDRDGTIIKNDDFLGRNGDWRLELEYNDSVISFLSYLQTKFKTTKIVVSNQTGVARKLFDCSRVEEINQCVDAEMKQRGVKIVSWQYCPDADLDYVEIKKDEINFDYNFVKEKTKRKPNTLMVDDALKELGRQLSEFNKVVVVGNSDDDMGLAENLKAKYIDVVGKSYEELVKEIS